MSGEAPAALPRWVVGWSAALVVIQGWHALVVALLPATLPGGSLAPLGWAFHPFMAVHRAYALPGDGILVACTWLDVLEILVLVVALAARGGARARLLALGNGMYAYKVVIVFAIEVASGRPYTGHAATGAWLGVYVLPQLVMAVLAGAATLAAMAKLPGAEPSAR